MKNLTSDIVLSAALDLIQKNGKTTTLEVKITCVCSRSGQSNKMSPG